MSEDRRDPATDPHMSLRRFPQDPEARQPGERLEAFWARVGEHRPTPWQEGDDEPPSPPAFVER